VQKAHRADFADGATRARPTPFVKLESVIGDVLTEASEAREAALARLLTATVAAVATISPARRFPDLPTIARIIEELGAKYGIARVAISQDRVRLQPRADVYLIHDESAEDRVVIVVPVAAEPRVVGCESRVDGSVTIFTGASA
jgi:hypothetical protein